MNQHETKDIEKILDSNVLAEILIKRPAIPIITTQKIKTHQKKSLCTRWEFFMNPLDPLNLFNPHKCSQNNIKNIRR